MDDEARRLWDTIHDFEMRLRSLEASIAVLIAARQMEQSRSNYLPGWIIAIIGLLISLVSVSTSLWLR